MKDFSLNDFIIGPDNRTVKEIEYIRDLLPQVFSKDTHLNMNWGKVPNTNSDFKLTLTYNRVNQELKELGFKTKETSPDQLDEPSLHLMPASDEYKELFTKALFKKVVRFITQNWYTSAILAHFDESLPNFHVFLDKNFYTADNDEDDPSPKVSNHKAQANEPEQEQPTHQPLKQRQKELEHLRFLQHQAEAQQADAVEEEKKKLLQRKRKQQEQRQRYRHQPQWWQQGDNDLSR